ncbi:divergent PAP2 family protein [Ruminococcus sp.]|uniref:divergent PAP2 family protein n=1 Tax=Ruminococcus sp. TaxID=41978 RepID=UPI0025F25920|nr:divergent PAP2 family protein [Ruminococcus sp.]MBQ8965919.1 divergent PAP2 family protein [Ruminococcus sp.]
MKYITDLFSNVFVMTALASWAEAQVLKTIIHAIVNRKLDISRLFGDGGMPSGHSATVTSLAACIGLVKGLGSVEFAIAGIVAVVVCHDAMGVRLETGKQSTVLNEMMKAVELITSKKMPEVKLKEFVGHTPSQVGAGVILGIVNAIIVYNVFLR